MRKLKLIALLLALGSTFVLGACAETDTETTTPDPTAPDVETVEPEGVEEPAETP